MTKLLRPALVAAVIAAIPLLLAPAAAGAPATTEIIRVTEYFDTVAGIRPVSELYTPELLRLLAAAA